MMKTFYKGFDEISSDRLDCGDCVYLRHRSTGLDVFHLRDGGKENLFAFAFRTPPENSTGVQHILEHSVLCGSRKFPLKEPFVNLMSQSVSTFLNAMTYPDFTVYPASSMSEADYFNLMDVYGDAVFFPLLREETFLQEGWRVEIGGDKKPRLQGVVYNEMKGSYSSFNSVASDAQTASLSRGSCYEFDSGGDPRAIPSLSYKRFKECHETCYVPGNCLLFLCGGIPTERQLDFIQSRLLDRIEKDGRFSRGKNFMDEERAKKLEALPPMPSPIEVRAKGPSADASGSHVTVNWRFGDTSCVDDTVAAQFIAQLLSGNDSSPMSKALNESNLGDQTVCGCNGGTSAFALYFGLNGVKKGKESKVKDLIFKTIQGLVENGVKKNDIEAAITAMDFCNREVTRADDGPFSLVLMTRAVAAWNKGKNPASMVSYTGATERLAKKIRGEKKFSERLLARALLENNARSFVVTEPDKSYAKEREGEETKTAQALALKIGEEKISENLRAMRERQSREESEEEAAIVPRVSRSDLPREAERMEARICEVAGEDGKGVTVFLNEEPSNAIVYLDVLFPVDALRAEDLRYIDLLCECAFNTGWGGGRWDERLAQAALCSGDISASPLTGVVGTSRLSMERAQRDEGRNFVGRDWIKMKIKFPAEKTEEAMELFALAISSMDFSDSARVKMIAAQEYDSFRSSVIPLGSFYALSRASCLLREEEALLEIWKGLSQLFALKRFARDSGEKTGEKLSSIMSAARSGGAVIHVTADGKSMERVLKSLPSFAKAARLSPLSPKAARDSGALFNMTLFDGESARGKSSAYTLDAQTGFAAEAWRLSSMDFGEAAAASVFCHWMNSNSLWENLRAKGGAYGANVSVSARSCLARCATYRDPAPNKSLDMLGECFEKAARENFSKSAIDRAVTGCYVDFAPPHSPEGKGETSLRYALYAVTQEEIDGRIAALLEVDEKMAKRAAEKFFDERSGRRTVTLGAPSVGAASYHIKM